MCTCQIKRAKNQSLCVLFKTAFNKFKFKCRPIPICSVHGNDKPHIHEHIEAPSFAVLYIPSALPTVTPNLMLVANEFPNLCQAFGGHMFRKAPHLRFLPVLASCSLRWPFRESPIDSFSISSRSSRSSVALSTNCSLRASVAAWPGVNSSMLVCFACRTATATLVWMCLILKPCVFRGFVYPWAGHVRLEESKFLTILTRNSHLTVLEKSQPLFCLIACIWSCGEFCNALTEA